MRWAIYYYPQAAVTLRIRWEDFGSEALKKEQEQSITVLAKSVDVQINDYTQADSFSLEIDYKQFPFDPRSIRACGVTIAMADVKEVYQGNNSLNALIPTAENMVFVGFADEESISFDDSSRTVRLEGRDFTCLLIDQPYLKGIVNLEQPVDEVIKGLLQELEATKGLKVKVKPTRPLPILANLGESRDELSGKKNSKRNESYWDVIQDVVSRAGLIAYIELDALVIDSPRTLYTSDDKIQFIYGQNLSSLEVKRKIGRQKNINIIVRSWAPEAKEVLQARIPLEATPDWCSYMGLRQAEVTIPEQKVVAKDNEAQAQEQKEKPAPYLSFRVSGISNKDHLVKVGESIFEELSRQQLEGSLETMDMKVSTGDSMFNILKIRNGTPVAVRIEGNDTFALKNKSTEEKRRFLIGRGYPPNVATALAERFDRISTPFYTKAVRFTMSESSGFKCRIDFVNFIELEQRK